MAEGVGRALGFGMFGMFGMFGGAAGAAAARVNIRLDEQLAMALAEADEGNDI